jgi:hypothetical protein
MPVDIDEIAPVGALRHQMGVPDFVEQGLRHEDCFSREGCGGAAKARAPSEPILVAATADGKLRYGRAAGRFDRMLC